MIAVDTNVLVRVLVDDPSEPEQSRLARQLLLVHGEAWVSQIVLIETVWVLESAFAFAKAEVLVALEALARQSALLLENADSFAAAVALYEDSAADFADCLILANAQSQRRTLYTFDRKLGRLHGARRLA
jgi:predicted nucleic-acid-binding protein